MNYETMIIKLRWWIIASTLVAIFFVAGGLQKLGFDSDARSFFSEENPQLAALEELENTYTKNDNIYIGIEATSGSIFTRETLAAIEELTEASWQTPYSNRVSSISNFQHTEVDADDLIVENLYFEADKLTDSDILRIKEIALSEDSLVNSLINPVGDMTGININVLKPGKSLNELPQIMNHITEMLEGFKQNHPNLNIYLTGGIPFDYSFGKVSQDDMSTLMPTMFIVIILGIAALLRSFYGAFATFFVILFSTITAMGMMGYMGLLITSPTSTAPVIIMTLAVADSVHFLSTMYHEMRNGKSKNEAIMESLQVNMKPIFLTSLTTAIGFLSMNMSDVPPFRDLGNVVAIGIMAAFVFSIIFLPAFMSVLPIKAKARIKGSTALCDRLGDFVVKKRTALFWGTLIFIVAVISGLHKIDLNDNFIEYFDTRYSIRTDTDYLVKKELTGLDIIEYSINANETGGITTPEYLNNLEKLAKWFESRPDVMHVNSFTDVIKRLNKNMHGGKEEYNNIPDNRELAAQYLLLYEMSLPFGLDLNNQINIDKSATKMAVFLKRTSSKRLRGLDEEAQGWMKENIPEYMHNYGSGLSVVFAHISERNIDTMLSGLTIALLLISAILIFALKSFKFGFISLVPNLFPALMSFGLWGYIDGRVGLAVAVVAAISMGIVVDDTVHFLIKYLRAKRNLGLNTNDAVKYSFNTVGMAIIITSVVLAAGFSVLALSGFYVNYSMGILTAIAIGFALFTDFLFLPPLLIYADKDRKAITSPEAI